MTEIFSKITEIINNRQSAVIATVVACSGSTPGKIGFKMLVTAGGSTVGTVGGGAVENAVIKKCLELIKTSGSELLKYNLVRDLGMQCGGQMEIFIESISSKNKLYIFGAGHIGAALARLVENLDFDTYIIDDRKNIFDGWITKKLKLVNEDYHEFISKRDFDDSTYIVSVTRSHAADLDIIRLCIHQKFAYFGVIGSRRKAEEMKKVLINGSEATEEQFNKIDIPLGLDIGAIGPHEIAISIASGLIKMKNQ
ncbi:MAG: XdhC/CoxI family protein [Candidatus Kapabacteria bacterium]|nr:XdhC/CoxI family protein [Candidatus Kapabacteria bacterium]